ncbi:hypothetical protein PILCRDRAFT_11809 [Piloderma croceum F 1598]|uniref:Uncharacterized protein n=1 Tax=Piloderma croceum (strain F 1598) TaxID=765440 RepID=A0A0C3FD04_PILCF|nr:hypothetical protein PILCRDRAFT_11809 [Piloderma croceum F 1598]
MEQKTILASMKVDNTKRLPYRVEVAIGMEATLDIATEADLANGSRGKINNIVLDLREVLCDTDLAEDSVVWLQYPPAMIVVEPFHHEFDTFPGLAPGLIPIFPAESSFSICYRGNSFLPSDSPRGMSPAHCEEELPIEVTTAKGASTGRTQRYQCPIRRPSPGALTPTMGTAKIRHI